MFILASESYCARKRKENPSMLRISRPSPPGLLMPFPERTASIAVSSLGNTAGSRQKLFEHTCIGHF